MCCILNKLSKEYKTFNYSNHFIEIFKKKIYPILKYHYLSQKSVNAVYNISQRSHFNTYLCRFMCNISLRFLFDWCFNTVCGVIVKIVYFDKLPLKYSIIGNKYPYLETFFLQAPIRGKLEPSTLYNCQVKTYH